MIHNSISGTIPAQLGGISGLRRLELDNNRLSGTIPTQLGDISGLRRLKLDNNRLSGTIPTQLGDISGLKKLVLGNNRLSGTIPAQLGDISGLRFLYLSNNQLAYPRSSSARTEYDTATRICRSGARTDCRGIPPVGCSAFADAQLFVADPNECVVCDNVTVDLVVVSLCILVGVSALAVFIRFVIRNPAALKLKRWVSSAAILINHAQTASIIASMRLEWPRSLRVITAALQLDLIMLPSASCLFGKGSRFERYALYASSAVLALLLSPLLVKRVALCCRRLAIADTAELMLSLVYSLLFTFAWSLVLEFVAYAVGYFGRVGYRNMERYFGLESFGPAFFTVPVLGTLLLVLLVRLFGNVLAFKRGVDKGVWRHPNSCSGLCGTRPIPPRRLERQVAYLVGRFARHAPRWQVAIWLRQFSLLLLAFTSNVHLR